ncbi:hypothetical protein ACFFN5_14325, partial [Streptomonospora salina]
MASDANTCNFPGCARPVPRSSSPGRPSQYCDLPEHTRWRAWRERQRLEQETAEGTVEEARAEPAPGDQAPSSAGAGPVTEARLRAEDLLTRFSVQAEQLAATLGTAREAFATMTDPASVEAQVEAARIDAARRVAEAESTRLAADNR